MTITDKDWDLLSAYADGELDDAVRCNLEARLAAESELAAELERIRRSKRVLQEMRPRPGTSPRVRSGPIGLAVAASVLLVIGLAAGGVWLRAGPGPGFDPHAAFAAKSYVLDGRSSLHFAAGSALGFAVAPNLSASNLVLVDVRVRESEAGESVAMHYRGYGGCRLTLIAEPAGLPARETPTHAMLRDWTTAKARFRLVADMMDQLRFDAIADFAEAQVQLLEDRERLRVAMADATAIATPCA